MKYAKAKRILFLVNTKNLGVQADEEFMAYLPNDDNQEFTELYGVTRLKSDYIPADNQVYISTIQRMYSIVKGIELDESAEETNPNEYHLKESPDHPNPHNNCSFTNTFLYYLLHTTRAAKAFKRLAHPLSRNTTE